MNHKALNKDPSGIRPKPRRINQTPGEGRQTALALLNTQPAAASAARIEPKRRSPRRFVKARRRAPDQNHPSRDEQIDDVGHSAKAIPVECPAFPCTCAKNRARDQNTTESDNSMADEKADEDQCCNSEEPYNGRHSVNSFLPRLEFESNRGTELLSGFSGYDRPGGDQWLQYG